MLPNVIFRGIMSFNSICYGNGLKQMCSFKQNGNDKTSATEAPWAFLDKNTEGGAFDDLTKSVQRTGTSFKNLVYSFVASIALAALMIGGLQFILSKSGPKKQELKEHIPWAFVGIIIIVSGTLIFTIGASIAAGLQSDLG